MEKISPYVIRWVIIDNYGKLFKYQINEAKKYGFKNINRLLVKYYGSIDAVKADAHNIKKVREIAEIRRNGKKSVGQGCVITDKQFGMMDINKHWEVWTSKGVELYNELTR